MQNWSQFCTFQVVLVSKEERVLCPIMHTRNQCKWLSKILSWWMLIIRAYYYYEFLFLNIWPNNGLTDWYMSLVKVLTNFSQANITHSSLFAQTFLLLDGHCLPNIFLGIITSQNKIYSGLNIDFEGLKWVLRTLLYPFQDD